ncbi:type I restriction endonuclease subunit R [Syntrophaceticus schinkii]|uniref:Type I restriction enzyme endonuclease subunit n=1 Tax=Syntrophaceticus schinkii TaxID=499207 RepID=A0A0B7MFB2_9FIRM|nr:type I restriction endonuclease subunit R [Syntrophaceticus schinkii]MDD2360454.1 type I restriction endonuclease subunit R [Syntrophaceticus schinkii]CEO89274.1 putative type I restriction enzyme HindVIIP R protein [Syntrophaceticus schinkii]
MYSYDESELEQAVLEWFQELYYDAAYGPEISPEGEYPEREDYSEVILKERLMDALRRINPQMPRDALDEAFRKVAIAYSPSLIINNMEFHRLITDGLDVQVNRDDGTTRTDKVWLFDFENLDNNDWLAVNQFTVIEHRHNRRPDVVVFVNGLPLVLIELKSSTDESVGIAEAFNQLQTYKMEIPSLLAHNSFLVISDGFNARVGTITANEDRFMPWRTVDGETVAPISQPQLEVLIKGMFDKSRFLDIIRNFILFQTDGKEIIKILAGYHQYHAVKKAVECTERAAMDGGDRRIGVIWHTQGSGKSLSMVFYAGQVVLMMNNPTIVVITDRNDLDEQLFTTFSRSQRLLRQSPVQATSRAELRQMLKERQSGGVIFTTIQKFTPGEDGDAEPLLNDRRNIVVIADEAHRSQYGFKVIVTSGEKEADIKYGYAKYMRDALPNASFIGFTGTPVELTDKNTPAVFGDYIDIYDMTRAVEDGTTVKIYYESRIAKLELSDADKLKIDEEFEEITEFQEEHEKQRQKSKWSRLEAIAGAEKRVQLVARDIVEHYEKRQEAAFGKAMVVVMSRRIAVDLYNAIIDLRPGWHSDDDNTGMIKVVMTGSASDPKEWQQHIGSKSRRKLLAKRMRAENDSLQIVIVRDMWLTGFDVPSLYTMYVDKPMSGHNLMQAIARVNRVFRDKPGGLVVDYIGIADSLKSALSQYTVSDRQNTGVDTSLAVDVLLENYELIQDLLYGFDYSSFKSGSASERMQTIVATIDYILGLGEEAKKDFINYVTALSKAYALCSTTDEAEKLNVEIGFFKAVKSGIIKMIPVGTQKKTKAQIDYQLNQLISKSVISEEVVDIFGAVGLDKPNIAILSDEFLEEVKGLPHKNLAVELLKRLLAGEVKAISRRNLIQSRKFSEMLENAIIKYQNRTIETTQVILELIELAKEMNEMNRRGEAVGLSSDELAFYDALGTNDAAVKIMGDEILKQIARDLTRTIKANTGVDWAIRESVRARMRITIKRLLKKYGYPPDKQEQAVKTVMEQAELMCGEEAASIYEQSEKYGVLKAAEEWASDS